MTKKQYPQWKKHLASPWVLASIALVSLVVGIMLVCLLSHFIDYFRTYIQTVKQSKKLLETGQSIKTAPFQFKWSFLVTFAKISKLKYILLILFGLWATAISRKLYKMRIAYKDINLGTEGTASFTEVPQAIKEYPSIPLDDKPYDGLSGPPVLHIKNQYQTSGYHGAGSRFTKLHWYSPRRARSWHKNDKLKRLIVSNGVDLIDTVNTNSITVGGSQSGKTELFTYPTIDLVMRASQKDSLILTDIKGNMVKNTRKELERFGYRVLIFNLVNTKKSMHYNPLELIKEAYFDDDIDEAETQARTFAYTLYHQEKSSTDPIWEESSIALFVSIIMLMCYQCKRDNTPEKITLYSLSMFVNLYCTDFDDDKLTSFDKMVDAMPLDHPARSNYTTIKMSQDVTRSSIYTGFQAKINEFASRNVAKLTAQSDFNFKDLAYSQQPIALFIVAPDYDDSNYVLMSTFITQCCYVLSKAATMASGSTLPRRVRFLLEEIGNIPTIKGLSRYMNVGLERGLIYHLVVQSLAQLKDKYGEKGQEALFSACGNKYYIMGDGKDDAELFSDLLGKTTVISGSRHGDPMSMDKSYGESEKGTYLLRADDLRQLTKGEWIVVRTKHREDLKGNRVQPKPLKATINQGTEMLHRYEYLADRFSSNETLDAVADELCADFKEVDLQSLIIGQDKPTASDETKAQTTSDEAAGQATDTDGDDQTEPILNFDAIKERQRQAKQQSAAPSSEAANETDLKEDRIDGINETRTPINLTKGQRIMLKKWYEERFSKAIVDALMAVENLEELKKMLADHHAQELYTKIFEMLGLNVGGETK